MKDVFDLSGKTALITGGATGLGKEFASALVGKGAKVILAARRKEKLVETATALQQLGGQASWVCMDVADSGSVDAAFAEIREMGVPDIVVNNAGVVSHPSLLELSEETWDQVVDINLKGAWLVARAAVKAIVEAERKSASIINISSILSVSAQKGTGPYAASKAGLTHLTRTMALEWARYGIRVNSIAPGYFASDLADDYLNSEIGQAMVKRIPQRRLGSGEDLHGPLLLLASDSSAYMTGSVITVDGGHSMPMIN